MTVLTTRRRAGLVGAMLALTAGVGAAVLPATAASAATPWCIGHVYYNAAAGGCNGNNTPGRDRLALECKVIGSDFYYWVKSAWHDRYADWQDTVYCYGGTATAVYVTFDHQN